MKTWIAGILAGILFFMTGCTSESGSTAVNKTEEYQAPFPDAAAVYEYEDEESFEPGLRSVMIEGEPFEGNETRFFAYIGLPQCANRESPVPGIVLLHGGGGTAYAEWVRRWNARGYAAIAVDMEGHLPSARGGKLRIHEYSGPARYGNFADIPLRPEQDTFWYHAVSIASRAYEILGNYEEVDENAIGLMGISWGGIIGSMVLGRDARFAFGIMVYGCGYLYESQNEYQQSIMSFSADLQKYYIEQVDAANTFIDANMPILWLNSDEDKFFSPMIMTKSHLATSFSFMSLKPVLAHGHEPAWEATEPYEFADSMVKSGRRLLQIVPLSPTRTEFSFTIETFGRTVNKVKLVYSEAGSYAAWNAEVQRSTQGMQSEDLFREMEVFPLPDGTYTVKLPPDAKTFYVYAEDIDGNSVSTQLYEI